MAALNLLLQLFPVPYVSSITSFTSFATALDSSGDKYGFLFQAAEAATITRLGFRMQIVTGTSPIYRISLQGINAAGDPDGTIKGEGSPASATFDASTLGWLNGSWNWVTLSNSYVCTKGEFLALVIDYSSGTINASNSITATLALPDTFNHSFPVARIDSTGTWAHLTPAYCIFGYGSATKAYGQPLEGANTQTFNNTTTPDEYAQRWILGASGGGTYKLRGVRFHGNVPLATTLRLALYDATVLTDTDELTGVQIDGDALGIAPSNDTYEIFFPAAPVLNLGQPYRVSLIPESTTNTTVYFVDVDAAADWDAHYGGQDCYLETRTDLTGTWSATLTRRIVMDLIIEDISPGQIFQRRNRVL